MLRVAGRRLSSSLSWKPNPALASTILLRELIDGGESSSRSNSLPNRGFSSTGYAFLRPIRESKPAFTMDVGSKRFFSEDIAHAPTITDTDIELAYKDLMAVSWDELPDSVILDVKNALSKDTDDKTGKEVLVNVFRAAEAVEHFTGVLISLRMEIDDYLGLSGENARPLSEEFVNALSSAYKRYTTYLDAFGPEETYLRKKVETELGTRMIHLKMRCSGLGSEWGKVTVLGTSGLSGSYIEHRA